LIKYGYAANKRTKSARMKRSLGIILLCTTACTGNPIPTDPALGSVVDPLFERASQETAPEINISVNQAEPYAAIISQNFDERRFVFDSNARQLQLSNFGSQQIRYPQFRPGGQIRANGTTSLSLNVSQSLYDGGAAEAQKFAGQTTAITREIENLALLNDNIAEDILEYLNYHRNLKTVSVLGGFSGQLRDLLDLAETRFSGGIGTANEVSLFQLQLAEIETDIAIARSNAELAISRLVTHDVEKLRAKPTQPQLLEDRIPLEVMAALAARESSRSALEIARSNVLPQVSAVANVGFDPRSGLPTDDIGIDVSVNDPITFGGNTNLRIAEEDLQLAELDLAEATQDVQLQIRQLLQEFSALQAQQAQTASLADQAQARLDGFEELFLAGEAGITEAVSLIDTVQSTAATQIDLEFQLIETQVEVARLSGSLIPTFE